ncbi:hypothetical protein LJY25_03020 [Hymenobacter sp. BT175]|uniref:hypothetical protein n=1 Tax=Hymenobacter translucens TaxID=2886507 RepID=UPI001D0E6710|nr:hypothetical protein [Hymenobacter translucens]MCC2545403.1 hypothetical protein [Hymenobacter translucens]
MRRSIITWHYWTGLLLAVFILTHLVNHLAALGGVPAHLAVMNLLRLIYRNRVIEPLLLLAVVTQVFTGIRLFRQARTQPAQGVAWRVQLFSGLYLAFFLLVHTGAVLTGRLWFKLDTNLYFGAAGMNTFPFSLFFIPYYFLAVMAVFLHIASIHYRKARVSFGSRAARRQAVGIGAIGVVTAGLILYALTNQFHGLAIPPVYLKALGR